MSEIPKVKENVPRLQLELIKDEGPGPALQVVGESEGDWGNSSVNIPPGSVQSYYPPPGWMFGIIYAQEGGV